MEQMMIAPKQSEIIAAGRALLNDKEIGILLRIGCATDHDASRRARAIAKDVLLAAKRVIEPAR